MKSIVARFLSDKTSTSDDVTTLHVSMKITTIPAFVSIVRRKKVHNFLATNYRSVPQLVRFFHLDMRKGRGTISKAKIEGKSDWRLHYFLNWTAGWAGGCVPISHVLIKIDAIPTSLFSKQYQLWLICSQALFSSTRFQHNERTSNVLLHFHQE